MTPENGKSGSITGKTWSKGMLSFWSWNNRMDEAETRRQIRSFLQAGMSGFFIHARGGLQIGYLSEEWLRAVEWAVEEAEKSGLEIWLYDEDAWPSGFCGGKVPAAGEKHQQKWLAWEMCSTFPAQEDGRTIAVYVNKDGGWTRVEDHDSAAAEHISFLRIYYELNPYYSDLLCPETVDLFIQCTHEVYRERFGNHFGKTIRGMFTDEPQYAVGRYPWSFRLREAFEAMFSYDLVDLLPWLLLSGKEPAAALRHDYWKCVSSCFVEAFSQNIGLWCEAHGLAYTGHVAAEDTLLFQMQQTAGAMPHYEWMHVPGIDHLGRRTTRPVVLKQVSSAARQMGRPQILSEMFGCSGWSATFADLKWIAEWQLTQGINIQCQHLAAYSLEGARKRDYPPALSYQQPWWDYYSHYIQYAERLSGWISDGKPTANVLLLHPVTSAWCVYDPEQPDTIREMDRRFGEITEMLLNMQVDFDYGDETLIARHGSVSGNKFRVGECGYSVVLIPALYSIERRTFDLLQEFAACGGTVVQLGRPPEWLEGRPNGQLTAWWKEHVTRVMPTYKSLEAVLSDDIREVRVLDRSGNGLERIYCNRSETASGYRLFFANIDRVQEKTGTIRIRGSWDFLRYDPEKNKGMQQDFRYADGYTWIGFHLEGGQSLCLEAVRRDALTPCLIQKAARETKSMRLWQDWELEQNVRNVLTLDYAEYQLDSSGVWKGPVPLIQLHEKLMQSKTDTRLELRFVFEIAEGLQFEGILAAFEDWGRIDVFINGTQLNAKPEGEWLDPCIVRVPVGAYLREGVNEIMIRRMFQCDISSAYLDDPEAFETERNRFVPKTELESIYLLGAFAVHPITSEGTDAKVETLPGAYRCHAGRFRLSALPVKVSIADLTKQGFWFFSGKLKVSTAFNRSGPVDGNVLLKLSNPAATVIEAELNGNKAGIMAWAPYQLEVTEWLQPGENRLTLTVVAGLRNTLGPHHHAKGEVSFVGPSTFRGIRGWEDLLLGYRIPEETWTDAYHFVPFGLTEEPMLVFESGE